MPSTAVAALAAPGTQSLPAAVSTALTPVLRGRGRSARVVAHTRDLVAVLTDPPDPQLVCLTNRDALRLPCAMVLSSPLPDLSVGVPATVGDGQLRLSSTVVPTARWWSAARPRLARPRQCVRQVASCPAPDLEPALLTAADALTTALADGRPLGAATSALLGFGPGLTPAGDDVLAGALVTLRAMHSARADDLADALAAAKPFSRTTAVSAGLLAHAARGQCLPQVAAFLTALDSPAGDVRSAHRDLLDVGHTSGAALDAGIRSALSATSRVARRRSQSP